MSVTDLQRVRISGAPYDRGVQLGQQAEGRIRHSIEMYREAFAHYTGLSWSEVRERATAYQPAIEAYDPEIVPEMAGTAEGAGLDLEDILALNSRTEVMYGLSGELPPECTAFGVRGEATATGGVLLGQNWDWLPAAAKSCILLEADLPGRPSFVTFVEAGLLAKMGFNSAGIGLVTNLLLTEEDTGKVGVPFHVVLRRILTSATFAEAVAAVTEAPRASSANYLIGSVEGELVDLEARPGGPEAVHQISPTRDRVEHANTFCGPLGSVRDRGLETLPDSPRRTDRMEERLDGMHGRLDVETVAEILHDHDGHPASICRHAPQDAHPIEGIVTVGSAILELAERRLHVALGSPCETAHEVIVPEFARQGEMASR